MEQVIRSRLKETLEESGKTLRELASETGFTYQALWKIANNKGRGIEFETLESICAALNCQVNKVIEYLPDD